MNRGKKRPRFFHPTHAVIVGNLSSKLDGNYKEALVDEIVETLEQVSGTLARGGFGQYNHEQLQQRLHDVLFGHHNGSAKDNNQHRKGKFENRKIGSDKVKRNLDWLIEPLMEGLIKGGDSMNVCVSQPRADEDKPLIYWLCQWHYLWCHYGWKGSDDIVRMALRRGATVQEPPSQASHQNESVLTVAVQYGSFHTVRHLLHGIRQQHGTTAAAEEWIYQQMVLQDLWSKVLDRSCPNILRLLLRYIPATERVWTKLLVPLGDTRDDMTSSKNEEEEVHVTAVDYMLYKVWECCCSSSTISSRRRKEDLPSACWAVVGAPSVEEYAQCLLSLVQKGVAVTPLTMSLISRFLCLETRSYNASSEMASPQQYAVAAAQLLFGNWIPSGLQQQLSNHRAQVASNRQYAESTKQQVCVICLEDERRDVSHHRLSFLFHNSNNNRANNPMTRLYCGHSFCIACITEWGGADPEDFSGSRTVESSCPICRKPLAREYLSERNRRWLARDGDRRRNTLGIDHHHPPGPRGPNMLSRDQMTMECQARGIPIDSLGFDEAKQELVRQWTTVRQQRRSGPNIMVDLAASRTLSPQHVAAKKGPVVISIQVNGVPMLAGLSGSSPYTVVSPAVVENVGLVTKGLASSRFQKLQCMMDDDDDDDDVDDSDSSDSDSKERKPLVVRQLPLTMSVIDELIVSLGNQSGVEVSLRNAVVPVLRDSDNAEPWRPGITLGMDFLESAAWTQTTVEVDIAQSISAATAFDEEEESDWECRRFMVIVHGGQHIHRVADTNLAKIMPEEFRFYAFNGRTFRTPLLHIDTAHPAISNSMFFSVGHANANHDTLVGRRRHRFTECEFCCRMFPFVMEEDGDNHDDSGPWSFLRMRRNRKRPARGMIACKFCNDMATTMRQYVYYCDEECQHLAHNVHRLRHEQYRGILLSWCRVLLTVVFGSVRRERKVFVVSFVLGVAVSLLLSSPSVLNTTFEHALSMIANAKH